MEHFPISDRTLATQIPAPWLQVLYIFQQKYPNACIAGGAIRDLVVGKPIGDVDIFLNAPADSDELEDFCKDKRLPPLELIDHSAGSTCFYSFGLILDGYHFEICPDTNGSDDPIGRLFDHFDFGICMIAFDGNHIHITKEFQQDWDRRTLTQYHEGQPGKGSNHLRKLVRKFSEYKLNGYPDFDDEIPF